MLKEKGRSHSQGAIRQAVRRSLKGDAARVVMRLGEEATVEEILDKMDVLYGAVGAGEDVLAEFYAAKQRKGEEVGAWSCRLEDILDRAKHQGLVVGREANEMLRNRFWNGLQQKYKDASRHKFDTIQDYDLLCRAIRRIEQEYKQGECQEPELRKGQVKMATCAEDEDIEEGAEDIKSLKGMVYKLGNQMSNMQKEFQKWKGQDQPRGSRKDGSGGSAGQRWNTTGNTVETTVQEGATKLNEDQPSGQPANTSVLSCWNCGGRGHRRDVCPTRKGLECWYCHEEGHRKNECPKNPWNLNAKQPLSGGGR